MSVRLARVARTVSGTGFPPGLQGVKAGELPFLKVSDLARVDKSGRFTGAANWISRQQAQELGARIIPTGATVFPKVGAALLGNARGHAAVDCVIDNNMMAVVPTDLDERFAYWLMRRIDLAPLTEGGTLPFVSDTAVRALQVEVPSLGEQRRIAEFLDDRIARIDQVVVARRTQIQATQSAFEAAQRAAVLGLDEGRQTPSDLAWARVVGGSRKVRRLGQLARMGTGHTPSRSNFDYWLDCNIPWLTTSDVHRFRRDEIDVIDQTSIQINELGLAKSAAVVHPARTVALSRTASAGFSVIMGSDMATSQDFVTWTCGPQLLPEFLLSSLRVMRPYLLGFLATGSTHKTIYFPDLQDLSIVVPEVGLQRLAVEVVAERADSRKSGHAALDRSIDLLLEYKGSLITAAVIGEVDVSTAGSGIPT